MKLKYIVIKHNGREIPIIFGEPLTFNIMSKGFTCIAAGTVKFRHEQPSCSGESSKLKLKNRGKIDEDIIKFYNQSIRS